MPPTIFVFTTSYYPFLGGAEVAVQEIAKRLAGEVHFTIITARQRRDLPPREERPEGTVIRVGAGIRADKFFLPLFGTIRTLRLIRERRPKLFWAVMVTWASGIPYLVNILRFWQHTPILLTLQEGDSEAHIRRSRGGLVGLSWRLALSRTDQLQTISTYLKGLAQRYGHRGPVEVIPNGVASEQFGRRFSESEKRSLRQELGIGQDARVVITVSRLVEKNAVDVLIRAIREFRIQNSKFNITLLIVGDGRERESLAFLAESLGMEPHVKFLGAVPYADVPQYLAISDIFCRPSRSEGLGSAFLEAMAVGLPIIGTPVGGITDFLSDGETGLFCKIDNPGDLAEKLAVLLENPELRLRIAANAEHLVAERYRWDSIAGQFKGLFRAMIAGADRPRILVATGIFPPDIGGPATYAKIFAEEFSRRGYRVAVLTYGDLAPSGEAPYPVHRVSRRLPKGVRHLWYFIRCFAVAAVSDIVYAQDTVSAGLPSALASLLLRKRLFLRAVGDYAWEQGALRFGVKDGIDEFQRKSYRGAVALLRRIQRFVAREARAVVTPSQYFSGIVQGWGVPSRRVHVIPNAVKAGSSLLSKSEARRRFGFRDDDIVVVSAGRLVPWKGFDALIDLFPELHSRHPRMHLVIIGGGPRYEHLRKKAGAHSRRRNHIRITGPLAREDVLAYLRAADLFILYSGFESFSFQIAEAFLSGVAVIASRMGSNGEMVSHGKTGLLVPYGDPPALFKAIERLLGDPSLRERLARSASRTLQRFSPATTFRILEELFSSAV